MRNFFQILAKLWESTTGETGPIRKGEEGKIFFHYTAATLIESDQKRLHEQFKNEIPPGWNTLENTPSLSHHMTININTSEHGPAAGMLGQNTKLVARTIAGDDKVIAVGVEPKGVTSSNQNPHITIAVNPEGGEAKHSNELDWGKARRLEKPMILQAKVSDEKVEVEQEVSQKISRPPTAPMPDDPEMFIQKMKELGKPDPIIKMAMRGKGFSDEEIRKYFPNDLS